MAEEAAKDIVRNVPVIEKGKGIKDKLFSRWSIGVRRDRVAKVDETDKEAVVGKPEKYLVPGQKKESDKSPNLLGIGEQTLYAETYKKLRVIAESKQALNDQEIEAFYELLGKLPGGKDENRISLSLFVGQMILKVSKEGFKEEHGLAEKTWGELCAQKTAAKRKREISKQHPEVKLVYDYFDFHGVNPETVSWKETTALARAIEAVVEDKKIDKDVLRVFAERANNPNRAYRQLLAREGHPSGPQPIDSKGKSMKLDKWKSPEDRIRAYEQALGLGMENLAVNVAEFWERQLTPIVDARMEQMRGKFSIMVYENPKDPVKKNKWKWDVEKMLYDDNPEGAEGYSGKGFKASGLVDERFKDFRNDNSAIAQFLQKMGRDNYWEGKRREDIAFWSKFMGMAPSWEGQSKSNIYQELDRNNIQDSDIRNYAGAEAWKLWREDKELVEVYDKIFAKVEPAYANDDAIYHKPIDLNKVVPDLLEAGFSESKIVEAIMISQVYATDMVHNTSSKNRMYTTQMFNNYYIRALVTDSEGKVIDLLSPGFGLNDTVVNKMYMCDPRNAEISYAAFNDDRRRLNRQEHSDQIEKEWKTVHFRLGVGYRGIFGGRAYVPDPEIYGHPEKHMPDDIHLPGNVGDYLEYNNDLTFPNKKKDGTMVNPKSKFKDKDRLYLHQHAVYSRLKALEKRQEKEEKYGTSILGWLDEMTFKYEDGIVTTTIKEDVQTLLGFFEDTAEIDMETDDHDIQRVLKRVRTNPMTWGIMFSMQDSQTFELMLDRCDLRHAFEYEIKAKDMAAILGPVLAKLEHDTMLDDIELTTADVVEVWKSMEHRFRQNLNWYQAGPLLEFARMVTLARLAKTLPTQEQVEQTLHQGKLMYEDERAYVRAIHEPGNKEREKLLKGAVEMFGEIAAENTLIGQSMLGNILFIKNMAEGQLMMIEKGYLASADATVRAFLDKLKSVRVLGWEHARDIVWKSKAFMWSFLGTYAKPGQRMEHWQTLDVVWEKDEETGEFKDAPTESHQISIQDISDKEKEEFFYEMGRDDPNKKLEDIYEKHRIYIDTINPETGEVERMIGKSPNMNRPEGDSERIYLVFKSSRHREQFYEHRTRLIINLFYGREAGSQVELDKYFDLDRYTKADVKRLAAEDIKVKEGDIKIDQYGRQVHKKVEDWQLIRQIRELNEEVLAVQRVNAYYLGEQIHLDVASEAADMSEAKRQTEKLLRKLQTEENLREEDSLMVLDELDTFLEFSGLAAAGKAYQVITKKWEILKGVPLLNLLSNLNTAQVIVGGGIPAFLAFFSAGQETMLAIQGVIELVSPVTWIQAWGAWGAAILTSFSLANTINTKLKAGLVSSRQTRLNPRMLEDDDPKYGERNKKFKAPRDTFERVN